MNPFGDRAVCLRTYRIPFWFSSPSPPRCLCYQPIGGQTWQKFKCWQKKHGRNGAFYKEMAERRSEIYTNHGSCLEDSERGRKMNLAVFECRLLGRGRISSRKIIISCSHAYGEPKVSLQTMLPPVGILYRRMKVQQLQQFSEDG